MKHIATLLLLAAALLCSPLQAATLYMGTGGNDANDGLTWETRKLTLAGASGAIATAATGDTIEVGAGTYTAQNNLSATISGGKSLTITPYQSGAVTLNGSGTQYVVLTGSEANAGTIEFRDMSLDIGTSSRNMTIYAQGEKPLTFTRCTIGGGARHIAQATAGTGFADRTLTFTDCTFTMVAASRNLFDVVGGNLIVTGGSGDVTGTTYGLISAGGALGTVSLTDFTSAQATLGISNSTLTACTTGNFTIEGCTLNKLVGPVFSGPEAFDSVKIIDNTLAADETAGTRTTAMFSTAPTNTPDYYVVGNTCTGWKNGIQVTTASRIVVADNIVTISLDIGAAAGHCLQFGADTWVPDPEAAVLSTLKRKLICRNNHVTVSGDGDRHAMFVGQSYAGGSVERNYVKNDVANANFGAVLKCSGVSFRGNIIHCYDSGLYLAGATGCTVADNTIVVSTENFVLGFSATGRDPVNNHVYNNVLYGVDASINVIDFGALNSTYGNYLDENICFPVRFKFNNTGYTSLAAIVAGEANYVHYSGEAMHQATTFANPHVSLTNYLAGHGATKTGGLETATQKADGMGAVRKRKVVRMF